MGLGCVMENLWLMAEELGIGMHVLIVFSDSSVEEDVKNTLHPSLRNSRPDQTPRADFHQEL